MTPIKRGFTLVEMIVSLAIFSIVAVVALGALAKIIDANSKAQTLQAGINNLSFAMETMSREMRVGNKYDCLPSSNVPGTFGAQSCSGYDQDSNGAMLAFLSSKTDPGNDPTVPCNLEYAYRFRPDGATPGQWILEKAEQRGCGTDFKAIIESDFAPVLDQNVIITGYHIQVSSGHFPLALIRITGYAGVKEKEKSYFDLQTAVSARTL